MCLDVLKENWTPVLGVVGALESVGRLLGEPGTDSPLGVEVAGLLREGDVVGFLTQPIHLQYISFHDVRNF